LPLPVRRAPARARRRGCCSTRAMAPHGRAARRVAGPVTERRRNPVNVRVCNVGGLRWPLIAFASYQPTDCRPLATYRRHSLAVAVLHSTPPHPTCLSHPSLSALGLIQSIPHSSGATGVPGEASRGSLYESVCQVTIYVHRTASGRSIGVWRADTAELGARVQGGVFQEVQAGFLGHRGPRDYTRTFSHLLYDSMGESLNLFTHYVRLRSLHFQAISLHFFPFAFFTSSSELSFSNVVSSSASGSAESIPAKGLSVSAEIDMSLGKVTL
jgi:hypothetical protein